MTIKFAFLLSLVAIIKATDYTLEECKCWTQYQPELKQDGKAHCVGILLDHFQDCNIPERPNCKCAEGVTGILNDKTGTWCSIYEKGVEKKRWECENKDEWTEYKKKYDEYEKTLTL